MLVYSYRRPPMPDQQPPLPRGQPSPSPRFGKDSILGPSACPRTREDSPRRPGADALAGTLDDMSDEVLEP
jgi:hypothetical protein